MIDVLQASSLTNEHLEFDVFEHNWYLQHKDKNK